MQRVMSRDKRCRRNWFQLLLKWRNFVLRLLMLRRDHELLYLQAIKVMLEAMEILMPIMLQILTMLDTA